MKPDNADSYYSLATAENNLAVDMAQGRVRMNEDDSLYAPKPEDIKFDEKLKLSDKENKLIEDLYDSAIANYRKYIELNPNAKDKADVENQIEKIMNRNSNTVEE